MIWGHVTIMNERPNNLVSAFLDSLYKVLQTLL